MRDAKWVKYFQGAVLAALSLPAACGGKVVVVENAPGVGELVPPASCEWKTSAVGTCSWSSTFTGDPTTCVGFATSTGTPDECLAICGKGAQGDAPTSCAVTAPDANGVQTLSCSVSNGSDCPPFHPGNGGRRPEYFASLGFAPALPGREIGTHFARVACMEAGSVEAFRALRDELRAHGAPERLIRAASRAMRDELRHVRQTSALARRFGEEPIAPMPPPPRRTRSLEAIARENALEGCVRETYSALECAWQSTQSADPGVRDTMARIARDEMRHLALSWSVHRWAMSRLDRVTRAAILAAQRRELLALAREVAADPAEPLVRTVGLPRSFQSLALIGAIDVQVEAALAA